MHSSFKLFLMKPSIMSNAHHGVARLATTTTLCAAAIAAMTSCHAQTLQSAVAPAATVVAPIFPKPAVASSSPIHVGKLLLDGATTETLSLFLPLLGGDTDDDSTVVVEYREAGRGPWRQALDLFKHHKAEVAPYAGMIFGLKPDTRYDVRITVLDPDGVEGEAQQTVTMRTRALPPVIRADSGNTVAVSNTAELKAAIDKAQPGQVILLAPGTYAGMIRIYRKKGTRTAPITLRGADDFKSVISGGEEQALIIEESDYIHIERLHITGAPTGIYVRNWTDKDHATRGNVIRDNRISKVDVGIRAVSNGGDGPAHRDLYIADNVLEGNNAYGDVSTETWNDEGIVIVAESSELGYNTISGFGDSLGLSRGRSRAIDIHHNHVKYGGDDGVELDLGYRNVVARENLLTNTGDGVSFQYIIDGPGYAHNNLIYNTLPGRGPFKIKPEAECNSGVYVLNNTSVNRGRAFINFSACGSDFFIVNNLFTGDKTERDVVRLDSSRFNRLTWGNNAFIYDGLFQFSDLFKTSFAEYRKTPRGQSDVLIAGPTIFRDAPLLDQPGVTDLGPQQFVVDRDFRLAAHSAAIGAGRVLPNIADGLAGRAPDIGAFQSNRKDAVRYGARGNASPTRAAGVEVAANLQPNSADEAESTRTAPLVMAAPVTLPPVGIDGNFDLLPAGQWSELGGTQMLSVVPKSYFKEPIRSITGPVSVMIAWSGGAFDSKRNRLLVWGGGHADYAGNEVYAFDLKGTRWLRLTDASNPPAKDTEAASDGNPVSRHTYGGLTYMANLDSMLAHGGSRYASGDGTVGTWLFHLADNRWERKADQKQGSDFGNILSYDETTGTALQVGGNLARYDARTDKWTILQSDPHDTYSRYGTFDSKRNQFLYLGNTNAFLYDVGAGTHHAIKLTGDARIMRPPYPGLVYVKETDKYYGWAGGSTIYEITPGSWETKALPVPSGSAVPTAAPDAGTYGRFQYAPSKRAFIAVNRIEENVFVYKLGPPKDGSRKQP